MFEHIPLEYAALLLFFGGAVFTAILSRRTIELKVGSLTLKIEGSSTPPSLPPGD
jgi:hypothetical protein